MGDYKEKEGPAQGLSVARMMAHITYLQMLEWRRNLGHRRLNFSDDFEFSVQGYLDWSREEVY